MICSVCKKDLDRSEFYTNKHGKKATSWCKRCHTDKQTAYERSPKGKLTELRKDAKRRGIGFDLTIEDLQSMWGGPCRYCGLPLKLVSIDRVDNAKHYTKKNTVPCCRWCNYTKATGSSKFFYQQCLRVAKNMPDSIKNVGAEDDCGDRFNDQIGRFLKRTNKTKLK